ncbi:MAG: acetylxylan esterase [Candidatus Omnitrophica bacterium]|nr:acetylxylan esterase [Candidatus Omnitrophota bacterium]
MRRSRWFAARCSLCALLLAGCVSFPMRHTANHPTPLPAELRSYYDYRPASLKPIFESTQRKSGYRIHRLRLEAPSDPMVRPIRLDWYEPGRSGRLPVILMSPILAGNDLYVREFASFYAGRGMHAVIVYRPKEVFSPERDLKDIETHLQESVIQMRRAIDWLQTLESVDPEAIGSYGISMGAILTTILAAVEPRVKANVFGLPAGEVARIIMSSQDKTIRKRRKAYLERHGWTEEKGLEELEKAILSEPMRFAPAIDPARSLVIVGLFDRVLGLSRSLKLWRGMGRPALLVLPTGHYTAYFATPHLKIVTYSFLRRHLYQNRN